MRMLMTDYEDKEDDYDDNCIVDVEVGEIIMEVLSNSQIYNGISVHEEIQAGEHKAINELQSRVVVGEGAMDGAEMTRDEEAKGRGYNQGP